MTGQLFYPFKTAPGKLFLSVDLENGSLERNPDDDVLMYKHGGACDLRITVMTSPGIEADLLPKSELSASPVRIDLVLTSDECRRREVIPLGTSTEAEIGYHYEPEEWAGSIRIEAVLSRTTTRKPAGDGLATDLGARLAWSSPCILQLEPPAPSTTGTLDILWEDFGDSNDHWLRRYPENLWALRPGDPLTLYLNAGVDQAGTVLSSGGKHGPRARIRDATFHQIALGAWSSILCGIAATLMIDCEGDGPRVDSLQEWERMVLSDWAPFLYPETQHEDALKELFAEVSSARGVQELTMCRVPSAIQARISTSNSFTGSCREHLTS